MTYATPDTMDVRKFQSDAPVVTSTHSVSFVGGRSALGLFTFPSEDALHQGTRGYFGPNFQFILRVPDSGSTVSLLGFALLGLAAVRRKLGC